MKLDEVFAITNAQKQRMDEAPYGIGAKLKDTAMGGLKSIVGRGQKEQGNKEAGEKANDLMNDFKVYIGQVVGRGQKTVPAEHLIDFLGQKGIDASKFGVIPNDTITPKKAQDVIMKATRETFKRPAPQQQSSGQTPAGQQPPPAQDQTSTKLTSVDDIISAISALSDDDLQTLLSKI